MLKEDLDFEYLVDVGKFEVLDILSHAWYGKMCYDQFYNNSVYSGKSKKTMTVDEAALEFAETIRKERKGDNK